MHWQSGINFFFLLTNLYCLSPASAKTTATTEETKPLQTTVVVLPEEMDVCLEKLNWMNRTTLCLKKAGLTHQFDLFGESINEDECCSLWTYAECIISEAKANCNDNGRWQTEAIYRHRKDFHYRTTCSAYSFDNCHAGERHLMCDILICIVAFFVVVFVGVGVGLLYKFVVLKKRINDVEQDRNTKVSIAPM